MVHKYQEQFERMMRWYEHFQKLDSGIEHTLASENYQDMVFAFFMNCFHLKDWIKNDDTLSSKPDVEGFVRNTTSMQLCGDICNGIKHLTLNRAPHSTENPKFGPRHYSVTVGGDETTIKIKWVIKTNSGDRDAFQLATDCVNEWKEFIKLIPQ